MSAYSFTVTVEAESYEQAQQVMQERVGFDEDYGFDYTVDWSDAPAGRADNGEEDQR